MLTNAGYAALQAPLVPQAETAAEGAHQHIAVGVDCPKVLAPALHHSESWAVGISDTVTGECDLTFERSYQDVQRLVVVAAAVLLLLEADIISMTSLVAERTEQLVLGTVITVTATAETCVLIMLTSICGVAHFPTGTAFVVAQDTCIVCPALAGGVSRLSTAVATLLCNPVRLVNVVVAATVRFVPIVDGSVAQFLEVGTRDGH